MAGTAPSVGNGYAHAIFPGGLHVTLLFGRPSGDAARELVTVLDGERFDGPRLSLFDAGAVEAIETEAFEVLTRYMNHRRADLARVVTKQAIVAPRGMPGAIVTGYRAVFDFGHPVSFFADCRLALEHLGRLDAIAQVEALRADACDPLVHRLRQLLRENIATTLAVATRKLGVSERSLQRHLKLAATSFSAEVLAARVAIGKRLLVETDKKLAAIALAAGCASPQSFATMFRRATGETPGEFRARLRRGGS